MTNDDDFYEDDEPVEDVVDAFESGEPGITAPPSAVYISWMPGAPQVLNGRQPAQV